MDVHLTDVTQARLDIAIETAFEKLSEPVWRAIRQCGPVDVLTKHRREHIGTDGGLRSF